jgi:hypothetical protein
MQDVLPDGSYLALSHAPGDFQPPGTEDDAACQNAAAPLLLRDHSEVDQYFEGFDLLELCPVQAPLRRPDRRNPSASDLARIQGRLRALATPHWILCGHGSMCWRQKHPAHR